MRHVLVVYASADEEYVARLVAHFGMRGIPTIAGAGADVGGDGPHSIDSAAALVPVMSPDSETLPSVSRAILRAEQAGCAVLPLLVKGDVFFHLANVGYEDHRDRSLPSAEFVERLRRLAGSQSSDAGPASAELVGGALPPLQAAPVALVAPRAASMPALAAVWFAPALLSGSIAAGTLAFYVPTATAFFAAHAILLVLLGTVGVLVSRPRRDRWPLGRALLYAALITLVAVCVAAPISDLII